MPPDTTPLQYWLFKSEPDVYSIEDLARDGRTTWEGVRNYEARNLLRDRMRVGDGVLFYHSNADPLAVVGVAEIVAGGQPDPFAWRAGSPYFDPKSDPKQPTWFMVEIRHVATFRAPVTREAMLERAELRDMVVLRRGSRLSVNPVTQGEFECVVRLGLGARAGAVLRRFGASSSA